MTDSSVDEYNQGDFSPATPFILYHLSSKTRNDRGRVYYNDEGWQVLSGINPSLNLVSRCARLTGIVGNISLARTWANPEDRLFKRLTEAEEASHRARDLARQLLTFAKGGTPVKKVVPIIDLLEQSVLFALRGTNVRSQFFFKEDLWPVEIDETQISQVIHNLVINAQQAMPEGGAIQIHAENLTAASDQEIGGPPFRGLRKSTPESKSLFQADIQTNRLSPILNSTDFQALS